MNGRRKIMGCLLLVSMLVAGPALAVPVDGWAGWWAGAWDAVLAVFGASETTESEPEPTPEPAPPTRDEEPTSGTDCATCGGGEQDGGPSLDPNG